MKISAEVVKGQCPTCTEHTILVSIDKGFYRCMNCGTDLEQHINGKISYIPILTTTPKTSGKHYLHDWEDEK
jgi:uncharacterized protein (DUF983 family)